MTWGSISLFGGSVSKTFLEKENPLETLIVISENVSPKGFSWLKMKYFEIQFWRQILDIYRQRLLSHISRQFENLEIYRDLYGKPFKHDWVAIKSCFSDTNLSNFRRLLLRYTAENSQVT